MIKNMQISSSISYNDNHIWINNQDPLQLPEYNYVNKNKDKQQRKAKKNKRVRTMYTTEQQHILEMYFAENNFIKPNERHELSKRIGIGEKQIKVWFQNRRMKLKKDSSDDSYSDMSMKSPDSISSEMIDSHPQRLVCNAPYKSNCDEILNELLLLQESSNIYYNGNSPENGYVPSNQFYNYQNMDFVYENDSYPTEYYPYSSYVDQNQGYYVNESNLAHSNDYDFRLSY